MAAPGGSQASTRGSEAPWPDVPGVTWGHTPAPCLPAWLSGVSQSPVLASWTEIYPSGLFLGTPAPLLLPPRTPSSAKLLETPLVSSPELPFAREGLLMALLMSWTPPACVLSHRWGPVPPLALFPQRLEDWRGQRLLSRALLILPTVWDPKGQRTGGDKSPNLTVRPALDS